MKNRYISKRYWEDKSTAMGQSDEMAKFYQEEYNMAINDEEIFVCTSAVAEKVLCGLPVRWALRSWMKPLIGLQKY